MLVRIAVIVLDHLHVVGAVAEMSRDGCSIGVEAIGCDLQSPIHAATQIVGESVGCAMRTLADVEPADQLTLRFQPEKRVDVAPLRRIAGLQSSFFLVDESPQFGDLHAGHLAFANLDSGAILEEDEARNGEGEEAPQGENGSLKVGDVVQWTSQGVARFITPRKVLEIADKDGEPYVKVEAGDCDQGGYVRMAEVEKVEAVQQTEQQTGTTITPMAPPPVNVTANLVGSGATMAGSGKTGPVPLTLIMDDGSTTVLTIPKLTDSEFEFFKGLLEQYKKVIVNPSSTKPSDDTKA